MSGDADVSFGSASRIDGAAISCIPTVVAYAPQTGSDAPNFADFVGKSWEHRYPELLESYYRSRRCICCRGCGSVCKGNGVDCGVKCGQSSWGFVADVGAHRELLAYGGGVGDAKHADSGDRTFRGDERFGDRSDAGSGVAGTVHGGESVDSGSDVVKESTLANRLRRKARKERKMRRKLGVSGSDVPEWRRNAGPVVARGDAYKGSFSQCADEVKKELAETRAQRFIAENKASVRRAQAEADSWERAQKLKQVKEEVQFEQAKQRLEVVKAVDVEKLKKKNEVKLMKETEVARVAVEKAFGTLAATGNAAGSFSSTSSYQSGTVKTVATDETSGVRSGTISPNSSISEAEVRKLQKDFLDIKKSNDEMVSAMRMLRTALNGDDLRGAKDIAARDYQAMYEESAGFTMDTDLAENRDEDDSGYIDKRGRFHFGIPPPVFEYDFDD